MKSFDPGPSLVRPLVPPIIFLLSNLTARKTCLWYLHLTALWFQSHPVCNKLFAFNLAWPIFQTPSWLICLSHTRSKLPEVILIFCVK